MNNMLFEKKFLSRSIVEKCIQYYENNDIFFKESEKYFYKKQNLLSKNKISYEDMENFIVDTRGSLYTQFYRCRKRKMDLKSCFTDIYFKNFLYIKLNLWSKSLYTDLIKILNDVKKENLILDLRGCGGGYLKQCIDICDLFLPEGEIVTLRYKNKMVTYYSNKKMYNFKHIFILVDENTASSAEILAYSLYANLNNVHLVGRKTYGKEFGQDYIFNNKYKFCLVIPSFKWFINNCLIEKINIIKSDSPLSTIKFILFST